MIMTRLMHMSVINLFLSRSTQPHNLYIEMQLIPGKWMIEIQTDGLILNIIHTGITRLTRVIPNR